MCFKLGIEIVQLSVNEPQEKKSYFSLQNQILPFDKVTQIKNVCPLPKALNLGLEKAEYEYIGFVAADVIFDLDANKKIQKQIIISKRIIKDDKIYSLRFALYDPFTNRILKWAMRIYYTKNAIQVSFKDVLKNDVVGARTSQRMGFREYYPSAPLIIGTHFDKPRNIENVFRRFYIRGIKSAKVKENRINDWTFPYNKLKKLYEKINDPLYIVAIKAFDLGFSNKDYSKSHNIIKDKELFNKYKELLLNV